MTFPMPILIAMQQVGLETGRNSTISYQLIDNLFKVGSIN